MGTRSLTIARLARMHERGIDVSLLLFSAQMIELINSQRIYLPLGRMGR